MTQAERRIVEFLMTSNATEMADLPDWFLALVEGGGDDELSYELITAASLMFVRQEQPGIEFDAARRVLADYASDPARLEAFAPKLQAFRLSCGFDNLKRAGLYEEVLIGDSFDPDGEVSVRISEEDWEFFNSNPTKQEIHVHMQRRRGLNRAGSTEPDVSSGRRAGPAGRDSGVDEAAARSVRGRAGQADRRSAGIGG